MRKDNLKILLKKVELEQPSPDFTTEIMEELLVQQDHVLNAGLKSILQRSSEEFLPSNFTHVVMTEIHREKIIVNPIISKKAWVIISCCFTAMLTLILFMENRNVLPGGATAYLMSLGTTLRILLGSTSTLFLISFFSVSVLVLIDYFFQCIQKTQSKNNSPIS
jgi:hypothetical protein